MENPDGMVVDSVSHVLRVSSDQIEPPPAWLGGLTGGYIQGVARLEKRLVVILKVEALLTMEEMTEVNRQAKLNEPVGQNA